MRRSLCTRLTNSPIHVGARTAAGTRDRLTHDYFGEDLALVWRVVERYLPALRAAVLVLP